MLILSKQKEFLIWLGSVILCTIIIAVLGRIIEENWSIKRTPAALSPQSSVNSSASDEKITILRPLSYRMPKQFAKAHAAVEIEMIGSFKGALTSGASGEIKAILTARTELHGYQYAWILPENIKSGSAALSGSLDSMTRGESVTLSLDVTSETDTNQHIHLHVYKIAPNGEAIGQMALFNTTSQEEINQNIQSKAQALDASFEERPVKMMQ